MSKYLVGSLKLSCGILCIYLTSLVIAPIAQAETNISNAGGTTSYANGFVSGSGSGGGEGGGSKSNDSGSTNAGTAIRAAQGLSVQLQTAQSNYNNLTALANQLSSLPLTPSTPSVKPSPVRFAIKSGGVLGEALTNCGCENTDVVITPSIDDNSAKLAAAKAAQAQAAIELADAQAQARQFLAGNQASSTGVSPANNRSIPLW